MAELLSVQIHAPSLWAGGPTTGASPGTPGTATAAAASVLKKVDNRTVQAARTAGDGSGWTTLKHLPRRRPIDIEFKDLTYSVSEGRKRGNRFMQEAQLMLTKTNPRDGSIGLRYK